MTLLFRDAIGPRLVTRASVICIGAFDGVHCGHQQLLTQTRARAQLLALNAVAVSFEPLPREFFGNKVARLTSPRQKFERLSAAGMEVIGLLRFNQQLSEMQAADFIEHLLVKRLYAREIWVGPGFRFGHARRGDLGLLNRYGEAHGFTSNTIPELTDGGERISSSRIRRALMAADHLSAKRMLGRNFSICEHVVHGLEIDRTYHYPTANLLLYGRLPPVRGTYAVQVHGAGMQYWPAVAGVEAGSMAGDERFLLKVHLIGFSGDLYGHRLEVEFIAKLRDELRFTTGNDRLEQIRRDVMQARNIFSSNTEKSGVRL